MSAKKSQTFHEYNITNYHNDAELMRNIVIKHLTFRKMPNKLGLIVLMTTVLRARDLTVIMN